MDQSIEYGVNMSRRIDEVIARDQENGQNKEINEVSDESEFGGNL